MQYEVITKIRKIKDFPSKFPRIVICNTNIFTTSYSYDFINLVLEKYAIYDLYNSSILDARYGTDLNGLNGKIEFVKYLAQSYAVSSKLTDDQRKSLGYSLENFIISCKFAGSQCSLGDFEWYYHFYNGNCFVFNSGRNMTGQFIDVRYSNKAGLYDALQLEIFAGVPENLETYGTNAGLIIYIKDQQNSYIPLDGLSIQSGAEVNVVLNKVITEQLKKPYSDCDLETLDSDSSNSVLYQEFIKKNFAYRQHDCMDFCYQYFTMKNCNCYDGSVPKLSLFNVSQCLTLEETDCLYTEYVNYLNFNREKCDKWCPLECKKEKYDTSITTFTYPIKGYADILLRNPTIKTMLNISNFSLNHEDLKKNILKLNIYFESLSYASITEQPSTNIVSLLSNIGGTLGLFLGMSALSFIEIFEFLFEILFIWYEDFNNNLFKQLYF